jgi:hypothetical protein
MGGAALPFSPPPIATPAPSGLAYKRNMGPLNMPRPSIGKPISAAGVPTLGANSGLGSIALAGALGGIIGGYSSGDMWGAAKGAFGGAFLGAIAGGGIPYAYKYGADMALSVKGVSQYSDSIVRVGQTLNTADSRRALFAAGGMLGGVAFGGSRNSRRGFNKDRGSRIGR